MERSRGWQVHSENVSFIDVKNSYIKELYQQLSQSLFGKERYHLDMKFCCGSYLLTNLKQVNSYIIYPLLILKMQNVPFAEMKLNLQRTYFLMSRNMESIKYYLRVVGIKTTIHEEVWTNIESWTSFVRGKFKSKLWTNLFFNIIWSIWCIKNEINFNDKTFCHNDFLQSVKNSLRLWVLYYYPRFPYNFFMVTNNISTIWN